MKMSNDKNRLYYRKDSLEYFSDKINGKPFINIPISILLYTLFFSLLFFIILFFIYYFSYSRSISLNGFVAPSKGFFPINSTENAIITGFFFNDGDSVKKGDVIFKLEKVTDNSIKNEILEYKEYFNDSKIEAKNKIKLITNSLFLKKNIISESIVLINNKINIQEKKIELSKELYEKYILLLASKSVSKKEADNKHNDFLEQNNILLELKKEKNSLLIEKNAIDTELHNIELSFNKDIHDYNNSLLTLSRELSREISVVAPYDGFISSIIVKEGQLVSFNQQLCLLLLEPINFLNGYLYVSPDHLGFLHPNMVVNIRYNSYPYQKFGQFKASIEEISTGIYRDDFNLPTSRVGFLC